MSKAGAIAASKAGKEQAKIVSNFNLAMRNNVAKDYDSGNRTWKMDADDAIINVKWDTSDHTNLISIIINKESGQPLEIKNNGNGFSNSTPNPDIPFEIPISSIVSIEGKFTANSTVFLKQSLTFKIRKNGGNAVNLDLSIAVPKNASKVLILEFEPPIGISELSGLLNEDALYYSQQIWMNSSSHFLSMQLSPYKIPIGKDKKELSLTEYIDPKPIAVMGNSLAFIFHDNEDEKWQAWKKDNINADYITTKKVALPTDGIFGEAVLGRYNSAEKLDMTRFWNWQDSPIPFSAPEIAAVQAGQHTVDGVQRPGNLDSSVLSIQSPQQLPDPTGMQGVLQAITVANLFRDMSGIAQTSALAQSALNASSTGAIAAGNQAGANMATFANFQVEMAKIAASLAPMLLGLPPLPTPATKTISGGGAALNAAKDFDSRQNQVTEESGSASNIVGGGGSAGSSPATGVPKSKTNSKENDILDTILGNPKRPAISLPSAINTVPDNTPTPLPVTGNEKKTSIFPPELSKVKEILEKAAISPDGVTVKDQDDMLVIIEDDLKNRLIPSLLANAPDFEKLEPVLKSLLDVIAIGHLVGVGDELQATANEAMKIAKESTVLSLNNTIDLAKSTNSLEKLKLAFKIVSTGNLLGFNNDNGSFNPEDLASKLQLTVNVDTDLKGPTISNEINTGETGFLKVFAELAMGDNDGITGPFISVGVVVSGGTAQPSASGNTDDVGRFVCNILCTDRAQFSISGIADTGIPGVSREFVVNI